MKKTIHANGIMMAYQIDGPEAAPVVVMSNSLMSSLEMWDDTIAALTANYRVVRYDTRGHGQSEVTPGPYSIDLIGHRDAITWSILKLAPANSPKLHLSSRRGAI